MRLVERSSHAAFMHTATTTDPTDRSAATTRPTDPTQSAHGATATDVAVIDVDRSGVDPKIAVVQRLYGAFAAGEVEVILAHLTDDVDWVAVPGSAAAPWFGTYRGKADVPRFFGAIGASVEVTEFAPLAFTASDSDVIVAIQWGYRARSTGRQVSMLMYHWWRFEGELVAFVRTAEDTQLAAEAFAA